VSSLPEVTGDAALLVDPYDPSAIANAISRVISSPSLREDLRKKGLARARQFSWETSVRRIREIYREVALEPNVAGAPTPTTGRETGGAPPQ
jgi:glycosyltransferase involved in cell wall biosynthesis